MNNIKKFFKSVEAISVLVAFIAIIITGAKIFAYLGIAAYIISNINKGVSTVVKVSKMIFNSVVNFLKKK